MDKSINDLSIEAARLRCLESIRDLTEEEKADVLEYVKKLKARRYSEADAQLNALKSSLIGADKNEI